MIDVRRAADRFETVQPGITTRHCFSSGAHYDRDNIAFGTLIALDEHVVAPGAGFGWHAHRGVEIISWVLQGTLRHEDSTGRVEHVGLDTAQYQSARSGIEHAERNASDTEALHLLQLVLLGGPATPAYLLGAPPLIVGAGAFTVLRAPGPVELAASSHLHLFLARGTARVAGQTLQAGDSARVREMALSVEAAGEVILWRSGESAAG
ncbi:MAG: pirin family protein [Pseudonocardiales bacterium]|nr:MAG: pirin family protein [Pseudonocardiales bacterium]